MVSQEFIYGILIASSMSIGFGTAELFYALYSDTWCNVKDLTDLGEWVFGMDLGEWVFGMDLGEWVFGMAIVSWFQVTANVILLVHIFTNRGKMSTGGAICYTSFLWSVYLFNVWWTIIGAIVIFRSNIACLSDEKNSLAIFSLAMWCLHAYDAIKFCFSSVFEDETD